MRHLFSLSAAFLLFGCGTYTIGSSQGNIRGADAGETGGQNGSGGGTSGAPGNGGATGNGGAVGNGGAIGSECTDPGQCAVPAICQVCPDGTCAEAKAD